MSRGGLERVNFSKGGGLVPVVVQDQRSGMVAMLGYMNPEALERTLQTGHLHLWSRSREELWLKGKRSGNILRIARLAVDCDGDALLAEVEPATGETPICHTGAETCFFTSLPTHCAADSSLPRPGTACDGAASQGAGVGQQADTDE